MAEESEVIKESEKGKAGGGSKKLIIIMAVGALLLVGLTAGIMYFLFAGNSEAGDEAKAEKKEEVLPLQYYALAPEFTVSYQVGARQRFVQTSIALATRNPAMMAALTLHDPMIRNEVNRIIGEQSIVHLRTEEGKLELQKKLFTQLSLVLQRDAQVSGLEAVVYTNFVMQ
ncbi:MAG: flagellar basal body-associated FliL family protein [Venatoribacter sp.]